MADAPGGKGFSIAGHKVEPKVLLIAGGAALVLFLFTRKSGGGTTGVPIFPQGQEITTEVPVEPDLSGITSQLSTLNQSYTDLLGSVKKGQQFYTIKPGDTFQSIAAQFGIRAADIRHFNPWLDKSNWAQNIGRRISVPGSTK